MTGTRPGTVTAWVGVAIGALVAVGLTAVRMANGDPGPVSSAEWAPLGDVALGTLAALPSLLAVQGLRGRPVLLLAGGILSLLLAIPFSLTGLVLAVPGVLFLVAYGRIASAPPRMGENLTPAAGSHQASVAPTGREGENLAHVKGSRPSGWRRSAAVFLAVAAGIAALGVLFVGEQPVCYRSVRYEDGRVESSRDREAESDITSGGAMGQSLEAPAKDVVSQRAGCTSDILVPWESLTILGLCAVGGTVGRALVPVRRDAT